MQKEDQSNPNQNQKGANRSPTPSGTLVVDGIRYKTQLTDKYQKRKKWEPLNKGKIYSEFPGTVVKVDVSEGDFVRKGDRLYIYEAMKMNNRAYSAVEGVVKEVRIQKNDIIRKGNLLFFID